MLAGRRHIMQGFVPFMGAGKGQSGEYAADGRANDVEFIDLEHAAGLGIDFLNGAALVHGQNAFRNPVKNAAVALLFLKSLAPCLHNVNDAVKKAGRYLRLIVQINKGQAAFLGRPAGNIAANNDFKPPSLGTQYAFFKAALVAVQDDLGLKTQQFLAQSQITLPGAYLGNTNALPHG